MTEKKSKNKHNSFNKMAEITSQDIKDTYTDPDIQRIKDIYRTRLDDLPKDKLDKLFTSNFSTAVIYTLGKKAGLELAKRAETYPEIIDNFRGGKWDEKPKAYENSDTWYHKTLKNNKGEDAVVPGNQLPWDPTKVLGHDAWGNVSYVEILKELGLTDDEIRKAAIIDDIPSAVITCDDKDLKIDNKMVEHSLAKHHERGGRAPTSEEIAEDIKNHTDKYRIYDMKDLYKRSTYAENGDNLKAIAEREGVALEDLEENIRKDGKINPKYATIHKDMSLKDGAKVNLPRMAGRIHPAQNFKPAEEQTKIPEMWKYKVSQESEAAEKKHAEAEAILKSFQDNNDPVEDILYKNPQDMTYEEIINAKKAILNDIKDPVKSRRIDDRISNVFDTIYGTEPVKYDASGRMIEPQEKIPFAKESKEAFTKDNISLSNAFKNLSEVTAESGTKALQRGLNLFGINPPLKEDGIIGPKTTSRAKEVMANKGFNSLEKGLSVGAFENMVEENRKQDILPDKLKSTVSKIAPDAGKTLQSELNRIGKKDDAFRALKEDNDVGIKTASLFNKLKEEEEDEVKNSFRNRLKFDEDEALLANV